MAEILQEYRDRLAHSIGLARSALEAPPTEADADRAFSILAAACKTAEFLGFRAVIPPAHALESARAAAGPRVADWDAVGRARVVSALDGLDLAVAALAPLPMPPEAETDKIPTVSEPQPTPEAPPLAHFAELPGLTRAATQDETPSSASTDRPEPPVTMPKVVPIPITGITIGERLRQPNPGATRSLANSIAEIGLCSPITVVQSGSAEWILVAGLQRLNAVRDLRWEHVPAVVMEPEGISVELWKIDENLMRSELSRIERDQHLLRRKELYDAARATETGRIAPSLGGRGKTGFATDTEAELGLSKRSVNEAIHRARRIPTTLQERLKGTDSANSAADLNALARLDPKLQVEAVERVRAGRAETLRQASAQLRGAADKRDPSEFQFQRLVLAWNGARPEIRTRFLRWLVANGAMREISESDATDDGTPTSLPRVTTPPTN